MVEANMVENVVERRDDDGDGGGEHGGEERRRRPCCRRSARIWAAREAGRPGGLPLSGISTQIWASRKPPYLGGQRGGRLPALYSGSGLPGSRRLGGCWIQTAKGRQTRSRPPSHIRHAPCAAKCLRAAWGNMLVRVVLDSAQVKLKFLNILKNEECLLVEEEEEDDFDFEQVKKKKKDMKVNEFDELDYKSGFIFLLDEFYGKLTDYATSSLPNDIFDKRMMALYVASHYKNSPNDLQLMADAPSHHLFVLLGNLFKKVELHESIRYASSDPIESWLNGLLCLDVANYIPNISRMPHPSDCDLYYVNRDTLFSYHKESEVFLRRMMALYVASHYKNSPNDLQLMADAPSHHLFVLLGPVDESKNQLPDILCVIQVLVESTTRQS
ncbi:UPF0202 protein [Platanthera guangdongensis]|uniref:UPF0202 protein n=1 Tax=Platanthera guangdongensis TaxID=2320717 RepID=A0ABR2M2I8_9ASPA